MILVTGGGGFLGSHIVRRLRQAGHAVRIVGRNRYPAMEAVGAECVVADVQDPTQVKAAMEGVRSVFHVAGRVGYWGPYSEYWNVNVLGTQNLLDAAAEAGVERFVHTSTPSVAIGPRGAPPHANEEAPEPTRFLSSYGPTKLEGEKRVRAAHAPGRMHTVALRPHLIFGPGDPQMAPRILEARRKNRLAQIGDGSNRSDVTYVDNCVDAHILAWEALQASEPTCGGKAYFIGQEKPVKVWEFVGWLLEGFGAPAVNRRISFGAAYAIGSAMEATYRVLGKTSEPPLTRMAAVVLGLDHYFDHSAAERDFGYVPRISLEEGLSRTFAATAHRDA